jgi:hypothetical protein
MSVKFFTVTCVSVAMGVSFRTIFIKKAKSNQNAWYCITFNICLPREIVNLERSWFVPNAVFVSALEKITSDHFKPLIPLVCVGTERFYPEVISLNLDILRARAAEERNDEEVVFWRLSLQDFGWLPPGEFKVLVGLLFRIICVEAIYVVVSL